MLGKLFKYDMKQISRIMLPLVLLTFGTTLFGTAALKTVNEVVVPMESGVAQNVLLSSLYMVFGISVFVLCAFAVMAILFTVARFYKNLFTDEGYLTFTLPVNTSTIIMSKFWATVLWMAIASVAIVVCIFIYVSFGNAPHGEFFNTAFYKDLGEMLKIVMSKLELSDAMFLSEAVVCVILQVVHSVFMLFLAVTIGSIVAKKHKILASVRILLYYKFYRVYDHDGVYHDLRNEFSRGRGSLHSAAGGFCVGHRVLCDPFDRRIPDNKRIPQEKAESSIRKADGIKFRPLFQFCFLTVRYSSYSRKYGQSRTVFVMKEYISSSSRSFVHT